MTEGDFACCCGARHAFVPAVAAMLREFVARLGDTVAVTTPAGRWQVPRVYIAAHGLVGRQVPALAERYGWRREAT